MTSVVTVRKEVEKIKEQIMPKREEYILVYMADCLIVDRDKIHDSYIDEQGRKWSSIKVECVNT